MVTSHAPEDVTSGGQGSPPSLADVRRQVRAAAIKTARDMWGQVPKLLPLLGVLFYGLGSLVVDGFYTRLNTTPDAAGIGYFSIIEPAAVFAAMLAIIATAIAMVFDVVKGFFQWVVDNSILVRWVANVLASLATLIVAIIAFLVLKQSELWRSVLILLAPVVLTIVIIPLQILIKWFGDPEIRKSAWTRVLSVGLSLAFLVALCFGAHEWGVHDAGKVARGESVDVRIFGLDMSAIGAAPVHIQAVDSSPVIEKLSTDTCLFEIGSGPYNILLYDPVIGDTLSIPSNEIVVISSSMPCKK